MGPFHPHPLNLSGAGSTPLSIRPTQTTFPFKASILISIFVVTENHFCTEFGVGSIPTSTDFSTSSNVNLDTELIKMVRIFIILLKDHLRVH